MMMNKMALSHNSLVLCSLFLFIASSLAQTSFRPKALMLQVTKDPSTLQYLTHINQRTPLVPVKLTLHLGGQYMWVDCDKGYVSSSYKPVPCKTASCSLTKSKGCYEFCYSSAKPGCHNHTCGLIPDNPIAPISVPGQVGQDIATIRSTDGSNPGPLVSVPNLLFACGTGPTSILDGLASGVTGMAGLGRSKISLPSLLSSSLSFPRKFAICLSGANGVVFFGDGPYNMLPGIDVSKPLIYTPLILNPVSTARGYFEGDASSDYFIDVKSIKINSKTVPLNTSLLSIDRQGNGGTKISTVNPYTVMETSIYNAVTSSFAKELSGVPRVAPVKPFKLCFDSTNVGVTRVGRAVPQIDLVLPNRSIWQMFGSNSMVQVKDNVMCLGFVDGGVSPRTSIVIGGYQLDNNLLQFDLATSRLGFSSSLLFRQTTCANFNFTSN